MNEYISKLKKLSIELEHSFKNGNLKSTIVDFQKDYANDDQICLTSVTFIPDTIAKKILTDVCDKLKKIEPEYYYYPRESLHLTIKNIRSISKPKLFTNQDIRKVDLLFKKTIPKFTGVRFRIEDILVSPTSILIMAYPDKFFQKLVHDLDDGLDNIGVPDNKKYVSNSLFAGNITICRFTKKPSKIFLNELQKIRNNVIGEFTAKKVDLITCNAVCHPKSRKIIGEYNFNGAEKE